MARFDFDLFTIGAGSGGVRASRMAASYGARAAVAEERYLGGTCVNAGCIPKKLLVYAAHYAEDFADASGFGWSAGPRTLDWATLMANKDREIARLNTVHEQLLDEAGVRRFEGRARLIDPHTVEIGGTRFTAAHVLVATGGWPRLPDIPGIEHGISSNEVFHLKELPERVIVVGGGYIAVEFAGIFHGLGVTTTLLYRGDLFLRGFDDDVRTALAEAMREKGVDVRFGVNTVALEKQAAGVRARLSDGSTLVADQVLFATGRAPNTADLGLEACAVALDGAGAVVVDAFSRSSVPSIFAVGDVTNRLNLTPVAIHEGMALAATLFADRPTALDYENVPSAVFSQPAVGTVGLSEAAARAHYGAIDVYRSSTRPLRHALSGRKEKMMVKLVVDRASQRVVGAHMVGPDAGEIIQGVAIALKCGATKATFDATIAIHPTAAEEFVTMRHPMVPSR